MGDGRAEEPAERLLRLLVQVALVPEEDDLVRQERGADLGDGLGGQVAAEADAGDDGAEAAADLWTVIFRASGRWWST